MTRRDWWLGVLLLALVVTFHALMPRFEWQRDGSRLMRYDHWTGLASTWTWSPNTGSWVSKGSVGWTEPDPR